MMRGQDDIWVRVSVPRPDARLRLFCFPYAGGTTGAFRGWEERLPHDIELVAVQLPGRGPRRYELPFSRLSSLAAVTANALLRAGLLDIPHALFGHSMGALIAFELARALRDRHCGPPAALLVGGRGAPHFPDPGPALHAASEELLVAELRRLGGVSEQVLSDPVRRAEFLGVIRADFAVCETYSHRPAAPLHCPIEVFGGTADVDWPRDTLVAWRLHTTGDCTVSMFDGGHFFIDSCRQDFLGALSTRLSAPSDAPRNRPACGPV